jgi:hypothetical protein
MTETHQDSPRPERPVATEVDIDLLIVEWAELRPTYPVKELLGRRVINDADETIGALDDLMTQEDRIAFAILSVGGFLGLGAHKVVVHFENLIIDDEDIVLPGASKEALRQMTAFDAEQARSERTPRRRARPGVRDAGEIVETAAGEPIPGTVADIADGDDR